jgi:hypothetical protein
MYGIYDLSGGLWERTTGYINNGHENLLKYGSSFVTDISTKYATVYPYNDEGTTVTEKRKNNYALNDKIYGDAIRETSTEGTGNTSWHGDCSYYINYGTPFFVRSAHYADGEMTGSLGFHNATGECMYRDSIRCVLI